MSFIYALRCPASNAVRYIGKAKNAKTRLAAHLSKARGGIDKHHCVNWIRSLLVQGLVPSLEIIYTIPDGEKWQEVEARFIAEYRATGHPLTNSTSGGDGFHDMPPEVLQKRAAAQGAMMKRLWADPAYRERILAIRAGANATPEARAKNAAAVKAAHRRPGARAMYAAAAKADWARKRSNPAALERLSDKTSRSMKALWADPEVKARRLLTLQSPEVKAKRYAARDTPEKTAARIVKLKAAWVRRKARQQQAA